MDSYRKPHVIRIVCEGKSEKAYIGSLNSLFRNHNVPLVLKCTVAGSGLFPLVLKAYRKCREQRDRSCREEPWIWVDSDLYERNEKKCMEQYGKRDASIPAFLFSTHNFEDTLVLHNGDDTVEKWRRLCHGGAVALHAREYMPLLLSLYPDYEKGSLPERMIPLTPQLLHNAYRHSHDEGIPFKCDLIERLVPIIQREQPDFFN